MNTVELRQALDAIADGCRDQGATVRADQVQRRIRRIRRRRVSGAAVAVAAVLAGVLVLVPRLSSAPDQLDPLAFPEVAGGRQKVAETVGDRGQDRITLTVPRPRGTFVIALRCDAPRIRDTELRVNGVALGGVGCMPGRGPVEGGFDSADVFLNGVSEDARTLAITLTLTTGRFDQTPADEASTVLGVALYGPVAGEGR